MAKEDDDVLSAGADGAEAGVSLDEASGGMSARKLLLIVIPILVIGIVAALYFAGVLDKEGGEAPEAAAVTASAPTGGVFMDLPDLLVNLSSGTGQARFLKLKVKLEVSSAADLAALEAITPRVIDQFQTFLREMRVQDMRGSAGIYRLRQELLYRVNMAAAPLQVKDVLFQEILIQ